MKILSIGAHIGDAELMSGPFLVEMRSLGHDVTLLAFTAGELGYPQLGPTKYKQQKIRENSRFCDLLGFKSVVFEDIGDLSLIPSLENVTRLRNVIFDGAFDLILGHWSGSIHPDHRAASDITTRAAMQASISLKECRDKGLELKYCENWEDMEGFSISEYHQISQNSFGLWKDAIQVHQFTDGTFSGFRYVDYYTSLMTLRGCFSQSQFGIGLMESQIFRSN
jgi:LmbE family N-acetylglucosaminyl deacetylase